MTRNFRDNPYAVLRVGVDAPRDEITAAYHTAVRARAAQPQVLANAQRILQDPAARLGWDVLMLQPQPSAETMDLLGSAVIRGRHWPCLDEESAVLALPADDEARELSRVEAALPTDLPESEWVVVPEFER